MLEVRGDFLNASSAESVGESLSGASPAPVVHGLLERGCGVRLEDRWDGGDAGWPPRRSTVTLRGQPKRTRGSAEGQPR